MMRPSAARLFRRMYVSASQPAGAGGVGTLVLNPAFLRSSFQCSMAKHGHWVRVEWLLLLLGAIGCLQLLLELLTASSLGATTAARATPHHHDDGHVASEARAEPSVEMQHGDHHHETRGSAEAGEFCSGMPMVMGGMQGFSRESCVVLFFAQW